MSQTRSIVVERIVLLVVFAGLLAAARWLPSLSGQTSAPAGGYSAGSPAGALAGEFRGVSLTLHNSSPDVPYEQFIDEIAATGANSICLVVTGYQENASSASIFIEGRKSPPDERIVKMIEHAHDKHLRVMLMPIVLLENPREGEWRGKINPSSWDDWWEQYGNYVLHYAQIARKAGAEVFMVGSELVSTETQEDRWRNLIGQVRQNYSGILSYSANWDHYKPIKFWDALDIVGMTTYYDLTGGKKPTVETLTESWKPIRKEILEWQAKVGRPIMFTEVGWPNQVTCAQYPWDYYRSPDKPDQEAQANCFKAFFDTWSGQQNVAGVLVWEWRNSPDQKGGAQDTSYIPCGKLAMEVIVQYFKSANEMPRPSGGQDETVVRDQTASQPATSVALDGKDGQGGK